MPFPQPIIDLGILYATSRAPQSVGEDIVQKLTTIFTDLINNVTTIEAASTALVQLSCDPKAVTRIAKILATPASPPSPEPAPTKEPRLAGVSPQHRQRSSPWSAEEDERLLAGIYHYGLSDWQRVSQFVGNGRTRAQCGQRWLRCLDPNMKKDKWTLDEDQNLFHLVQIHGEHAWAKIAKELGSRTDVQCRYRYTHHIKEAKQGLAVAQVPGMRAPEMMQRFSRAPWQANQGLPPPGDEIKFDEIKTEDPVDVEPKPEDVVKQDATN